MKDLARTAPTGEHLHLVGDPRSGRVDQVDHRQPGTVGLLDHADDLLDGPGTPGAGLHRRVVGHQRDRPPVNRGSSGDHAVGRQSARQHVGERAVLCEAAGVNQQLDPVPGEELALRGGLLVVTLRAALRDPGPDVGKIGMAGAG